MTTTASPDDILTLEEAARALRVSTSTVRRRIRCGDLPAYRMGGRRLWVRRADLASLMAPTHTGDEADLDEEEDDEEDWDRPLTDEERDRALAALEALARLRAQMLEERGGVLFPPSEDLIREAREERSRQLS